MGWVAGIIFIVALIGNIFLFSGDNFDGGIGALLIAIALIVDAIAILTIGYLIYSKVRDKRQAAINEIVNTNYPRYITSHKGKQIDVSLNLVNNEILADIISFKHKRDRLIKKCIDVNSRLINLLACPKCNSLGSKLAYLNAHMDEIIAMKAESDKLIQQINSMKISISSDNILQTKIWSAFELIRDSEEKSCEEGNIEDIIFNNCPADLSLFEHKDPIVSLKIKENYFCLYGEDVIVFDAEGYFSTVLSKKALKIDVQKKTLQYDCYSPKDSKFVEKGYLTHEWLHECIDGTPDMRYKYNPLLEKWIDGCEYGIITISIATHNIKITISSQKAIEAFEELARIMK